MSDATAAADQLIVLNKDEDTVSFVDAETGETTDVVETDFNPHEVAVSPDGDRAFVANNKTNDVSVIDVDAFEEADRYDAGIHPDGIAYLER